LDQPNSHCEPISRWLRSLEGGDADAAQQLWDCYFQRLIEQAQKRIKKLPQGRLEAEDIAVSVFESLCNGAQMGRFKNVSNRDELWWLLLKMTQRKIVNGVRLETAVKRGGGMTPIPIQGSEAEFHGLVCQEPTPAELIAMEEEFQHALSLLPNQNLKKIAVMMLEGYTNREISDHVGVATATVTRKRRLIRETWKQELL